MSSVFDPWFSYYKWVILNSDSPIRLVDSLYTDSYYVPGALGTNPQETPKNIYMITK